MARILSIEDDPDLQHLLGLSLQGEGYEVHYAFTGKEGYEKVLSLNPDLVILDMMLPVMNGTELIAKIKEHKTARDIPIIVTTAYQDDVNFLESKIRALGVLEYLRKPVRLEEVKRLIRTILAGVEERAPLALDIRKGAVRIDPKYRTVWVKDRLVATLPPKRFELLRALLQSVGSVTRKELLRRVWGNGGSDDNVLEKTIQRVREDLGDEGQRVQTTLDGYELVG